MSSDVRRNGFTLLEVLCTLVILGVLGSLVFAGFGSALTGYTLMRETGPAAMQAELALIRLHRELAAACDMPTGGASEYTFRKADGTTFRLLMRGAITPPPAA